MTRGRITPVDWIMLLLAILSVAMLSYETWGSPTPGQTRQILMADYVIVGIFAVEYAIRFAKAPDRKRFFFLQWYELLGMIPVGHPAIRGFRLFRLVRIVVILSRFGKAADRAFGEEFTYRFMRRSKDLIVETIGDAVTMRVMDMTLEVLEKGDFAGNMADHLEDRGEDMMDIIVEKVVEDPQLGRIRKLPFFEDVVTTSSRVTQRVLIDLLRDPRMDGMLKDMIRQNVRQMRDAVAEKEALRRPVVVRG